jgi:thiol-disulfide isomerase/thioredoxin
VPGLLRAVAAAALSAAVVAQAADGEIKAWKGNTPRLSSKDLDGRSVDLKSLKGRVVLVNFWATWCEPCRDELPALLRLKEKLAGKPFELVTVNFGEHPEKIARFLQRQQLTMPVLLDKEKEVAKDWKVGGLPMTYVVDAKGRARYSVFGERDWSEGDSLKLVEKLIGEAPGARR